MRRPPVLGWQLLDCKGVREAAPDAHGRPHPAYRRTHSFDEPADSDSAERIERADQIRQFGIDGIDHSYADLPVALAARAVDGTNAAIAIEICQSPPLDRDGLHRDLIGRHDRNNDLTRAIGADNGKLSEAVLPGDEDFAEVIPAVAVGVTFRFIEQTLFDRVVSPADLVSG